MIDLYIGHRLYDKCGKNEGDLKYIGIKIRAREYLNQINIHLSFSDKQKKKGYK